MKCTCKPGMQFPRPSHYTAKQGVEIDTMGVATNIPKGESKFTLWGVKNKTNAVFQLKSIQQPVKI